MPVYNGKTRKTIYHVQIEQHVRGGQSGNEFQTLFKTEVVDDLELAKQSWSKGIVDLIRREPSRG